MSEIVMSDIKLGPVINSGFEPIVDAVAWQNPEMLDQLRVTSGGWLALIDEQERLSSVVGFSVEAVGAHEVRPPADLAEVRSRVGPAPFGVFNSDLAAKGLGSMLAVTPQALQPRSVTAAGIAVRSFNFGETTVTYRRTESDSPLAQKARLLRHGALLVGSAAGDRLTHSDRGTQAAVRFMERRYGVARVINMPVPPIWLIEQRKHAVSQPVEPQVLLVRGREYAVQNRMMTVGHYPAPTPT